MLWRPSGLALVAEWRTRLLENPKGRWDQGEFNMLASPNRAKRFPGPPANTDCVHQGDIFFDKLCILHVMQVTPQ